MCKPVAQMRDGEEARPAVQTHFCRSYSEQLAKKMEGDIRAGRWRERLPSERVMALEYNVSRRVIRETLQLLSRAGLVRLAAGQQGVVLPPRSPQPSAYPLRIAVLSPLPWEETNAEVLRALQVFQTKLQRLGIQVNYCHDPSCYRNSAVLVRRMSDPGRDAWVVIRSTLPMQETFLQTKSPVVIFGTSPRDVGLPCVDADYHAAAAHAVGQFHRRGMRRLFLINAASRGGGTVEVESGFRKACSRFAHADGTVLRYDEEAHEEIPRAVEQMLRISKGERFGVLAPRSGPGLLVLSHLLRLAVAVPEQACFLTCNWTSLFEYMRPTVAGYRMDYQQMGNRLARMTLAVARGGPIRQKRQLLFPDFHPGETLD